MFSQHLQIPLPLASPKQANPVPPQSGFHGNSGPDSATSTGERGSLTVSIREPLKPPGSEANELSTVAW